MMKRHWYYTLDGHHARPATHDEMLEMWKRDRHVARTTIGAYDVSTVFLVIDHGWGDGPPLLFETMVFGKGAWTDEYTDRYTTWEQAEVGHERVCALVRMKVNSEREPASGRHGSGT